MNNGFNQSQKSWQTPQYFPPSHDTKSYQFLNPSILQQDNNTFFNPNNILPESIPNFAYFPTYPSSSESSYQLPGEPNLAAAEYNGMDLMDEEIDDSRRVNKKRKLTGSSSIKSDTKSRLSILEDLLVLLDDGNHGISWCSKVDTEGDLQDGMQIYNDTLLEQALEVRRGVTGYGLSKHLAKDLRYYGFVYDKETKTFWNEDHKHPLTHRSYWQKADRTKCLQLKRMTSEAERNLSRLTSLMKNIPLAEILKVPEHTSVCPPPSKYINLHDLHLIFPTCLPADVENIKTLLMYTATNDITRQQLENGNVLTKHFDHLTIRLGASLPDFIADLREFVLGASKWYHGVMERDEAVTLLSGQPEGTFLIRESTQSDCYSLSWVKFDHMQQYMVVNHMRVEQSSAGFSVQGDESPTRTLVQWIASHSAYLKNPLPSPIYSKLIVQASSKKPVILTDGQLPANYIRGFPSRMDTSTPHTPEQ